MKRFSWILGSLFVVPLFAHDIITTKLTYRRDIAPIINRRCISCHSSGSTIPLTSYDEVRPWAVAIKEQVLSRSMPPWGAVKGFGDLVPDESLTEDETMIMAAWQSFFAAVFVFLGQAGTSVKGAYDVLVSMGIITYFIPYLFVFASMFRAQWERAEPDVIRVPGRKPVAVLLSCVGFLTTLLTIGLSLVPAPDESNKVLATVKVVGITAVVLGAGVLLYVGSSRRKKAQAMC